MSYHFLMVKKTYIRVCYKQLVIIKVLNSVMLYRNQKIFSWERWTIDLIERNVSIKGTKIALTNREFDILYLLAKSPGRIFSKEQIYDIVWQEPYSGDYNIVMSHIHHIREKIEDNPGKPLYIQTVWGIGYRFNKNLSSSL